MAATNLRFRLTGFALLCLGALTTVMAHEGHAPLPTRGARVDVKKGRIVLSALAAKSLGVQTAEVVSGALEDRALAYATLVSPWTQHRIIASRVSGRIDALKVTAGQHVEAGQVLAELSSPELESGQGDLLAALNDLDLAQRRETQTGSLADQQVSPERDRIEAQTRRLEAENAVHVARSKLLSMGMDADDVEALIERREAAKAQNLTLTSPLTGTVMHTDLAVGKVVEPFEHLFEVIDTSRVWVRIEVLERDLPKIETGQSVVLRLNAYPHDEVTAQITVKTNHLDPVSHLGTVWAELDNKAGQDPKYLPGMVGTAEIHIGSASNQPIVPKSALIQQGAERYVLVEEAATHKAFEYQKRSVIVLRESLTHAQIAEGSVFEGDRVVTTGSHLLSNFFIQDVLRLSPEAAQNAGLRLQTAGMHPIHDVLIVDGEVSLTAGQIATASSQVNGTLEAIHIERGQTVNAGDVIVEIASLELQNIQLELLQAHLELQLLDRTLQRYQELDSSQVLAQRRVWETENQRDAARNRRDTAYRQLLTIGLPAETIESILVDQQILQSLPIVAPISGSIVDVNAVLGQSIRADDPLFEIHDLSQTAIQVFLAERDAPRIQVGMPARVYLLAEPDKYLDAKVTRSSRNFTAEERTLSVWLELDQPMARPLRNGSLVRAAIVLDSRQPALSVPRKAVAQEGSRHYVFVQGEGDRFQRRRVTVGRHDDRMIEIVSGIEPGDTVAVQGVADLQTAHALVR